MKFLCANRIAPDRFIFYTIDDMVSVWTSLFTEILNKHAPVKKQRVKHKYQPEWLTSEILDLIKERNKYKLNWNSSESL